MVSACTQTGFSKPGLDLFQDRHISRERYSYTYLSNRKSLKQGVFDKSVILLFARYLIDCRLRSAYQ